jgi:hypothetical protein
MKVIEIFKNEDKYETIRISLQSFKLIDFVQDQ